MSDREVIESPWRALTSSIGRRDAHLCEQAIPGALEVGLLQTAGPAAIIALDAGPAGATVVAELVRALESRGWTGDDVLAELLTGLSAGSSTGRAPLTVDLDMLGDVLGDSRGGYLDLSTGDVWPMDVIDDGQVDGLDSDDDPDPDRWVDVDSDGSRAAYQDMVDFTAGLTDAAARDELTHAVEEGRGAFRRFQSALDRHEQHRVHWRVLSTERRAGRARAWLAEQGYDAIP